MCGNVSVALGCRQLLDPRDVEQVGVDLEPHQRLGDVGVVALAHSLPLVLTAGVQVALLLEGHADGRGRVGAGALGVSPVGRRSRCGRSASAPSERAAVGRESCVGRAARRQRASRDRGSCGEQVVERARPTPLRCARIAARPPSRCRRPRRRTCVAVGRAASAAASRAPRPRGWGSPGRLPVQKPLWTTGSSARPELSVVE